MKGVASQRFLLGLASFAALVIAYTAISNAHFFRADLVPPTQEIGTAFAELARIVVKTAASNNSG